MGSFFKSDHGAGPTVTDEMVEQAEATLGVRLPASYVALIREQNGGIPARGCYPTTAPTSWGPGHVQISRVLGIGTQQGIDGALGSAYMIEEWGYPDIGVTICRTPAAGPDIVMLDYRACGPQGEPGVVYVDDDRNILPLARTFAELIAGLRDCKEFA